MRIGKARLFEKFKRFCLVLLALAGESDYHVAGQTAVGKILPEKLRRLVKARGVVLAVHSLERRVAAGLEREVEMTAHAAAGGKLRAKLLVYDARLN